MYVEGGYKIATRVRSFYRSMHYVMRALPAPILLLLV